MDAWGRVEYEICRGVDDWSRGRRARAYAAAVTLIVDENEDN